MVGEYTGRSGGGRLERGELPDGPVLRRAAPGGGGEAAGMRRRASTWRTPSATCRWPCTTGASILPCGVPTSTCAVGPGAIAGCFVHETHARNTSLPRLAGWWGNDPSVRFRMQLEPEFQAKPGARRLAGQQPAVLATAPLRASLALYRGSRAGRAAGSVAEAHRLPGIPARPAAAGPAGDHHAARPDPARLSAVAARGRGSAGIARRRWPTRA